MGLIVLGCAVLALAARSYFIKDTLHIGSRARGSGLQGSGWETFVYSHRGTCRFNVNQLTWNYVSDPNPFPDNSGPRLYSTPADDEEDAIPTSARRGHKAISFDACGFGAGRYTSRWSSGAESSVRSHTAIRVPHWLIALLAFILPAAAWVRRRRRLRRGFAVASFGEAGSG